MTRPVGPSAMPLADLLANLNSDLCSRNVFLYRLLFRLFQHTFFDVFPRPRAGSYMICYTGSLAHGITVSSVFHVLPVEQVTIEIRRR